MRKKRLIQIVSILCAGAFLLLLAVPTLLSCKSVQKSLIDTYNEHITGNVAIEDISIGWTTGVSIKNLSIKDANGTEVLSCDEITSSKPLYSYIYNRNNLGTIKIIKPSVLLQENEGTFSLDQAFQEKTLPPLGTENKSKIRKEETTKKNQKHITTAKESEPLLSDLTAHIELQDGSCEVHAQHQAIVKNFSFHFNMEEGKKLSIDSTLDIIHGNEKGSVHIAAESQTFDDLISLALLPLESLQQESTASNITFSKESARLLCKIESFPLSFLDSLLRNSLPSQTFLTQAIGNSLTTDILCESHDNALSAKINITSDKLSSDLSFVLTNNGIQCPKTGVITWTCDPTLISILEPANKFSLVKPVTFQCTLKQLPQGPNDVELTLSHNTPILLSKQGTTLPFSTQLVGSCFHYKHIQKLGSTLKATMQHGNDKAVLISDISYCNTSLAPDTFDIDVKLEGNIAHLLSSFIDNSPLFGLLAESTKVQLKGKSENSFAINKTAQCSLAIDSSNVKQDTQLSIKGSELVVSSANCSGSIPAELLSHYIAEGQSMYNPLTAIPFVVTVEALKLDLNAKNIFDSMEMQGNVQIMPFRAQLPEKIGQLHARSIQVDYQKKINVPLDVHIKTLVSLFNAQEELKRLIGNDIKSQIHSDVAITTKGCELTNTSVMLSSDQLQLTLPLMKLSLQETISIDLLAPFTGEFTLTKDLCNWISKLHAFDIALQENVISNLNIQPFSLQIVKDKLIAKPLKGQITIEPIAFINHNNQLERYSINLPLRYDVSTHEIQGNLSARQLTSGESSYLQTSFKVRSSGQDPENVFPPIAFYSEGTFKNIPSKIISTFATSYDIPFLIGNSLSGNWSIAVDSVNKPQNRCIANVDGDGFNASLALTIADIIHPIPSKVPFKVQWQATPRRIKTLLKISKQERSKGEQLSIDDTVKITLECSKLRIPLSDIAREKGEKPMLGTILDNLELETNIHLSKLHMLLADRKDSPIIISPLTIHASIPRKRRSCIFEAKSEDTQAIKDTKIYFRGSAQNLWDEEGLQLEKSNIKIDSQIQNFPLEIFQNLSSSKDIGDMLVALIGQQMNAQLRLNIVKLNQGSIEGSISGQNFQAKVASLIQNGELKLKEPLTAKFALTESAGKTVLKDINPLFITAAKSEAPIELWIDNNGFNIPLKPFSITAMKIPNIRIAPGVIYVKNGGVLQFLLTLLKFKTLLKQQEMPLWFTPIYVEIDNGIIHCKRTDALLGNTLPIATWGKIDIASDYLDMVIAIQARSLASVLSLGHFDKDYMVQIPLKGKASDPKIDSIRATAKLAALTFQGDGKLSTPGNVIGGLLDIASSLGEKEDPVPPPTTSPLPWENEIEQKPYEKKSKKYKKSKQNRYNTEDCFN